MKIINYIKHLLTVFSTNKKHKNIISMYDIKLGRFIIKNNVLIRIQQILFSIFIISSTLAIIQVLNNNFTNKDRSINLERSSQLLMHAQRLAKSASIVINDKNSFSEIIESESKAQLNLSELKKSVSTHDIEAKNILEQIIPIWRKTQIASEYLLSNKEAILTIHNNYNLILSISPELIDYTEKINNFTVQNNLKNTQETMNLLLIANRILYNMHRVYSLHNTNPDTVFALNKDLIFFNKILTNLKDNKEYDVISEEVLELESLFLRNNSYIKSILEVMPILLLVKKSQDNILQDSEFLRNEIANLQKQFSMLLAPTLLGNKLVFLFSILVITSLIGLLFFSIKDYKARAIEANKRQQEAEEKQSIEQQKNTINQKAIIRLMNELQEIANGNLTQQATVDANITGAIADFINYTVEELKGLVQRVQSTANQVTQAFTNVQTTSMQLLSSTNEQAAQISVSSSIIENIARHMHEMADKTQQSMGVARDSITVTSEGQMAAQRVISGMQAIRVQIQDTSKHIKRLGESSLQISEITALIDNITQQTHILAINAAIQAANAGESGKGFSIIAKEIQYLADKSGQATQQIGQLIKTIQGDVQSAGSAMEYSIQGVVEGSLLTDAMDNALLKIQQTNQKLVQNMQQFAIDMSTESFTANEVSEKIKQLLNLTEETLKGTTQTSESIKNLSNVMKKLEQSVSRFIVN